MLGSGSTDEKLTLGGGAAKVRATAGSDDDPAIGSSMRKVAILGATKGMGRALARQLAARGDAVAILGRDDEEVGRSVADLKHRTGAEREKHFAAVACDLAVPDGFESALRETRERLGGLDCVIVTAAQFATQDVLESDTERARELLTINVANTIAFCEWARKDLLANGGGTLCVFSSVAGDRGRKPVAIYGASKAALSCYLEALDHKFRADGLHTLCVKPGFVRTSMTSGLPAPPFAGEPEGVAKSVIRAIDRKRPLIYAPGMWRWVMLVIRHLPRFVMRKVGF